MLPDNLPEDEQAQARVCARLLELRRPLVTVARVAAFVAGVPALPALLGAGQVAASGVVAATALLGWAGAEWLVARLRLRWRLFNDFATAQLTPMQFDAALKRPKRPMAERVDGARTLLARLGACTVGLVCLAFVRLLVAGA